MLGRGKGRLMRANSSLKVKNFQITLNVQNAVLYSGGLREFNEEVFGSLKHQNQTKTIKQTTFWILKHQIRLSQEESPAAQMLPWAWKATFWYLRPENIKCVKGNTCYLLLLLALLVLLFPFEHLENPRRSQVGYALIWWHSSPFRTPIATRGISASLKDMMPLGIWNACSVFFKGSSLWMKCQVDWESHCI